MARHHIEKAHKGMNNPLYNQEKEDKRFLKKVKYAKKLFKIKSMSKEAQCLYNDMFSKEIN